MLLKEYLVKNFIGYENIDFMNQNGLLEKCLLDAEDEVIYEILNGNYEDTFLNRCLFLVSYALNEELNVLVVNNRIFCVDKFNNQTWEFNDKWFKDAYNSKNLENELYY